jgi:ribosomal protein S19
MNAGFRFAEQLKSAPGAVLHDLGERSGTDDAKNRRERTMVRVFVREFVILPMLVRVLVGVRFGIGMQMFVMGMLVMGVKVMSRGRRFRGRTLAAEHFDLGRAHTAA